MGLVTVHRPVNKVQPSVGSLLRKNPRAAAVSRRLRRQHARWLVTQSKSRSCFRRPVRMARQSFIWWRKKISWLLNANVAIGLALISLVGLSVLTFQHLHTGIDVVSKLVAPVVNMQTAPFVQTVCAAMVLATFFYWLQCTGLFWIQSKHPEKHCEFQRPLFLTPVFSKAFILTAVIASWSAGVAATILHSTRFNETFLTIFALGCATCLSVSVIGKIGVCIFAFGKFRSMESDSTIRCTRNGLFRFTLFAGFMATSIFILTSSYAIPREVIAYISGVNWILNWATEIARGEYQELYPLAMFCAGMFGILWCLNGFTSSRKIHKKMVGRYWMKDASNGGSLNSDGTFSRDIRAANTPGFLEAKQVSTRMVNFLERERQHFKGPLRFSNWRNNLWENLLLPRWLNVVGFWKILLWFNYFVFVGFAILFVSFPKSPVVDGPEIPLLFQMILGSCIAIYMILFEGLYWVAQLQTQKIDFTNQPIGFWNHFFKTHVNGVGRMVALTMHLLPMLIVVSLLPSPLVAMRMITLGIAGLFLVRNVFIVVPCIRVAASLLDPWYRAVVGNVSALLLPILCFILLGFGVSMRHTLSTIFLSSAVLMLSFVLPFAGFSLRIWAEADSN